MEPLTEGGGSILAAKVKGLDPEIDGNTEGLEKRAYKTEQAYQRSKAMNSKM